MSRLAKALMLYIFCSTLGSAALCQNQVGRQPCPDPTADAIGCELIAWSRLQDPVPLPVTFSVDRQLGENNRQEPTSDGKTQRYPHPSLQTIVGVVVRNRGQYWLKMSGEVTLLLDDGQTAQRYEGRQVKITGLLDTEFNTFRVERIVPLA